MNVHGPIRFLVTVALAAAVVGCGSGGGAVGVAPVENASEDAAPAFDLPDVRGTGSVSLDATSGKLRLVDFWATWCPPCIEELPMFRDLHDTYADRGLVILGLSADEDRDMLVGFLERESIPWPNAMADAELRSAYNVVGLPRTFLVGPDGTILKAFQTGPVPKAVLVDWIERHLPGSETAAGA